MTATFLSLCQDVARESGVISGTQPTAVTGQTGLLGKVVVWTKDAWVNVQRERATWDFMLSEFSGTLLVGTPEYTAASWNVTDLGSWVTDNMIIALAATGASDETRLPYFPWSTWKQTYDIGSIANVRPTTFSIKPPSQSVIFGQTPDDTYDVRGEYYRSPQVFVDGTDSPTGLDVAFEQIIVQRALMMLNGHIKSADGYADAQMQYNILADQMRTKYLPEITLGGPLA
jgi:hypothetical protein